MRSRITYPAAPPAPDAPTLSAVPLGTIGARSEYYLLTYVTPYGESLPGEESSIVFGAGAPISAISSVALPGVDYVTGDVVDLVQAGGSAGTATVTNATVAASGGIITVTGISAGGSSATFTVGAVAPGGSGCTMTVAGINPDGGISLLYWSGGGTGYVSGFVTLTGGSGSNAAIWITASGGAIIDASYPLAQTGTEYKVGDTVTPYQPAGAITSISLTTAGSGYSGGIVALSGGGGVGAEISVAVNSGGTITGINYIADPGSGYSVSDILAPPSTSGGITGTAITAGGSGYIYGTVELSGGSGVGAKATLGPGSLGTIVSITIAASGSGYTLGDTLTPVQTGGVGRIISISLLAPGSGYSSGLATLSGGSGSSGSVNIIAGVSGNSAAKISPPDYPYPFPIYGYNVYAASSPGAEVLQNSTPVLPGDPWTEPMTGLVTGTASPPTAWSADVLTFGQYSYATKVPAYSRTFNRHNNVAASGVLETIFEHTDLFLDLNIDFATIGADIAAWNDFVKFAERGGIFSFYPDALVGGGGSGFTNYTLWDDNWIAAYKSPQIYAFKMKWRQAEGPNGGGSGGGGAIVLSGLNFADNVSPVDSGDHQNFTLPNTPVPSLSLQLFLKGDDYYSQYLFPDGVDYTLTGASIALNSALTGTFYLKASYRY